MQPAHEREREACTRASWLVTFGLAALVAACGGGSGGSPTTPSTPAPTPPPLSGYAAGTTLSVVSGETDAPVAGAEVDVAGQRYTTDANGAAVLTQAASNGVTVDIQAAGFLSRQTLVRQGVTRFSLWPDNSRLPAGYTQSLVYTLDPVEGTAEPCPMRRWAPHIHSVAVTGDFGAIAEAVRIVNEGTVRMGVTYVVGGSADATVSVIVDRSSPTCQAAYLQAYARVWLTGSEITRGEVVLCHHDTAAVETLAHELGHTAGLFHSQWRGDIMWPFYGQRRFEFSDRELLTLTMMAQRRGGNTWPDNDRAVTARVTRIETILD
jgi:hypothetical protein